MFKSAKCMIVGRIVLVYHLDMINFNVFNFSLFVLFFGDYYREVKNVCRTIKVTPATHQGIKQSLLNLRHDFEGKLLNFT